MNDRLPDVINPGEFMMPGIPAVTSDCIVTKVEGSDGKFEFSILRKGTNGEVEETKVTRWQKDDVTADDITQSIDIAEILNKMAECGLVQSDEDTKPVSATSQMVGYRAFYARNKNLVEEIVEKVADDLRREDIGIYTMAVQKIFGPIGYSYFRDLAIEHHPDLYEKMQERVKKHLGSLKSLTEEN